MLVAIIGLLVAVGAGRIEEVEYVDHGELHPGIEVRAALAADATSSGVVAVHLRVQNLRDTSWSGCLRVDAHISRHISHPIETQDGVVRLGDHLFVRCTGRSAEVRSVVDGMPVSEWPCEEVVLLPGSIFEIEAPASGDPPQPDDDLFLQVSVTSDPFRGSSGRRPPVTSLSLTLALPRPPAN